VEPERLRNFRGESAVVHGSQRLDESVLRVEPVYSQGRLKKPAKSSRQRRRVPLRERVQRLCAHFLRGSIPSPGPRRREAATSTAKRGLLDAYDDVYGLTTDHGSG
jgi:hypothetical protein